MYEFFEILGNVKTSQTAQFHSIYLPTDTDKHKVTHIAWSVTEQIGWRY